MNPENPQLNCLIMSERAEHHKLVTNWLSLNRRVGGINVVPDEQSLSTHLSKSQYHLCIVVVAKSEQLLPVCLLRHTHVPVLVLTTNTEPERVRTWYKQGATDVVSLSKYVIAQRAVTRLIHKCVLNKQHLFLEARIKELKQEVAHLQALQKRDKQAFVPTAANDTAHSPAEQVKAQLLRRPQPVIENIISNYKPREAGTDLPTRISILERFQQILSSEIKAPRFTAMLVSILTDDNIGEKSGFAKNVQDLTLHRAADTLQKQFNTGTILGRINQNALLLIQSSVDAPVSRDAANQVRDTLGSLGGLIDSATDVHINTMNMPAKTNISANEVVKRLEATTSA